MTSETITGQGGMTARVIEDSICGSTRLITMQLRYPRFVHAEFMTHRVFSRNASSSRAIPVAKMLEQVRNEPAMPIHWGANQAGMQAAGEVSDISRAKFLWKLAAQQAADIAENMAAIGLHKQVANRILEPFQFISVVVTATEWDNFFELRDHAAADPNIRELALIMLIAKGESTPIPRSMAMRETEVGWHLPYITADERTVYRLDVLIKASAARCARVSYNKHDGTAPSIQEDIALYDRLVGGVPIHASPVEHQAYAMGGDSFYKNFRGWKQHRFEVEVEGAASGQGAIPKTTLVWTPPPAFHSGTAASDASAPG